MLNWKTAGAGIAALGLLAAGPQARHASAQENPHARAQETPHAMAREDMPHGGALEDLDKAELHRQAVALTAVLIAHADADVMVEHVVELIDDNAAEIGGDTETLEAFVTEFVHHVMEGAQADPEYAATRLAGAIAQLHGAQQQ